MHLVEPTKELEQSYIEYIEEWEKTGEKISPFASGRYVQKYVDLLTRWRNDLSKETCQKEFVPASLFFMVDENLKIYGAIHIRHELNDYLHNYGGHIGYGIRPTERMKGYATKMLSLALPIAKRLGLNRVLITCNKNNIASARTIINNGGKLENEVMDETEVVQRYWITNI